MLTFTHATRSRLASSSALCMSFWLLMVALPSLEFVRVALCWPLYVHHADAAGDAGYVMAGGYAYLERLRAASDLYHMHRVKEVVLLDETKSAGYDFVHHRSQSRAERAAAYLNFLGVPEDKIRFVPEQLSVSMGSLSEAQSFAGLYGSDYTSVVVVTSAPHTRRSLMCFRRSMPENVKLSVYAASDINGSAELCSPLWHEYFKLLVYALVA